MHELNPRFTYLPLWAKNILHQANVPLSVLGHENCDLKNHFSQKDLTEWGAEGHALREMLSGVDASGGIGLTICPPAASFACLHAEAVYKTRYTDVACSDKLKTMAHQINARIIGNSLDGFDYGKHVVYYEVCHIADNLYGITPHYREKECATAHPEALHSSSVACLLRCIIETLYGHTPKLANVSRTQAFTAWVKHLCLMRRYGLS